MLVSGVCEDSTVPILAAPSTWPAVEAWPEVHDRATLNLRISINASPVAVQLCYIYKES